MLTLDTVLSEEIGADLRDRIIRFTEGSKDTYTDAEVDTICTELATIINDVNVVMARYNLKKKDEEIAMLNIRIEQLMKEKEGIVTKTINFLKGFLP